MEMVGAVGEGVGIRVWTWCDWIVDMLRLEYGHVVIQVWKCCFWSLDRLELDRRHILTGVWTYCDGILDIVCGHVVTWVCTCYFQNVDRLWLDRTSEVTGAKTYHDSGVDISWIDSWHGMKRVWTWCYWSMNIQFVVGIGIICISIQLWQKNDIKRNVFNKNLFVSDKVVRYWEKAA